ncbi:hypothetical protein L9F63_024860, partial [Diploptera punctata]
MSRYLITSFRFGVLSPIDLKLLHIIELLKLIASEFDLRSDIWLFLVLMSRTWKSHGVTLPSILLPL